MSVKGFQTNQKPLYNALVSLGVVANSELMIRLGLEGIEPTIGKLKSGSGAVISATGIKYAETNRQHHALSFSPTDILNQSSNLKARAEKDIRVAVNKNLKARVNILKELKFDRAFAVAASKFYASSIVSQLSGKLIVGSSPKNLFSDVSKSKNISRVYYPEQFLLIGVDRGKNTNVFKGLRDVHFNVKLDANIAALKVSGGQAIRTNKKIKVSKPGTKLTVSNFLERNTSNIYADIKGAEHPSRIIEINYWLNGSLDVTIEKLNDSAVNLGHVLGVQAKSIEPLLSALISYGTKTNNIEFIAETKQLLKDINEELNFTLDHSISENGGYNWELNLLIIEEGSVNVSKGAKTANSVRKYLNKLINSKEMTDFVKGFLDTKGSKTPYEELDIFFSKLFLTGKIVNQKSSSKAKSSIKLKAAKTSISKIKSAKGKLTLSILEENSADAAPGLTTILAILNQHLEDKLKLNMGKGSAPKSLNWRTGRFARSAEILALLPTRGKTIEATITYLRNPYDVFLPGGKLHNQLRDPRKLIGKSIRQILVEQFGITSNIRTRSV